MIWLIGDTHFYHKNIIKYCLRPFKDEEEMNEIIISNWNKDIGENDIVYHLGDVILNRKDLLIDTIAKLNGKKYLIRGNHDKYISDGKFKEAGFINVYKDPIILSDVILSHAPLKSTSNLMNVHAHTHNLDPRSKYFFYSNDTHRCISIELTDYKPVSLKSILEEIDNGKK